MNNAFSKFLNVAVTCYLRPQYDILYGLAMELTEKAAAQVSISASPMPRQVRVVSLQQRRRYSYFAATGIASLRIVHRQDSHDLLGMTLNAIIDDEALDIIHRALSRSLFFPSTFSTSRGGARM